MQRQILKFIVIAGIAGLTLFLTPKSAKISISQYPTGPIPTMKLSGKVLDSFELILNKFENPEKVRTEAAPSDLEPLIVQLDKELQAVRSVNPNSSDTHLEVFLSALKMIHHSLPLQYGDCPILRRRLLSEFDPLALYTSRFPPLVWSFRVLDGLCKSR